MELLSARHFLAGFGLGVTTALGTILIHAWAPVPFALGPDVRLYTHAIAGLIGASFGLTTWQAFAIARQAA